MMGTFRGLLAVLEREGLLHRVTERVSWRYEVGDRTREHMGSSPRNVALLFEDIADYPGWSLVTNALGSFPRIAVALGLRASSSFAQLVDCVRERSHHAIEPKLVSHAKATTELRSGGNVDLSVLPVPWWNREDAGRYLGTWHVNVTHSPDDGTRNLGVYRMQVVSANEATLSVSPGSHVARHLQAARRRGHELPMAVAIGVPEAVVIAAAAALPYGADEYGFAGALMNRPVEIARCSTVAIDVPATAEVVIEGIVDASTHVQDGPFLDYAGVPNTNPNAFRFRVIRVTARPQAVFRGALVGLPGAEDHLISALLASVGLLDFHGSRLRNRVQRYLLARRLFRPFQLSGRLSQFLGNIG